MTTSAAVPVDRATIPAPEPVLPAGALIDPLTGFVRHVKDVHTPEGAPTAYVSRTASVADARWLGEWPADRVSLGTTFNDPEAAGIAAVAEAAERYCGNFLPAALEPAALGPATLAAESEFAVASRTALAGRSAGVLTDAELPSYAPWQLAREGFAYSPLTDATETLWTTVAEDNPTDDRRGRVWAPAGLVYLNWRQRRFRGLPRTHHLNYAGIATGQGAADARDRGVIEVIERDALELWWHLDGPARGIDIDSVPGLRDNLAGTRLKFWLVELPSEFAPVMAALAIDPVTGIRAAGFSANVDPARAATKAALEAIHTWIYTLGVEPADGWVHETVAAGLQASGLLLPHDPQRNYLAAAGEHCARLIDLGAHVQLWLDPAVHPEERRFTEPALGTVSIDEVRPTTLPEVYRGLAAAGHRVLTRDLTTRDIATTSLRVVRTLVTGLVPNAPAAFTYYGMPRFAQAAIARGWRSIAPRDAADFTTLPAPHM